MQSSESQREALGWSEWHAQAWVDHPARGSHVPARVVQPDRLGYWLNTGSQQLRGTSAGRLKHRAAEAADLPVIGDWVLVADTATPGSALVIDDILARKTVLLRRRAGLAAEAQPLAANVDVALIVMGLDRELNLGLMQRAAFVTRAAGIEPVIVLNKSDVCDDWAAQSAAIELQLEAARVVAVSAHTGQNVHALAAAIGERRTGVLMGASGVGKSSLLNQLLGAAAMKTGDVRDRDRKGFHTTTHRQLFALPSGALLIDGPGVRELGVVGPADAVEQAFPEIAAAALRCVHRGCRHQTETGCAVQHDVRIGQLREERLATYRQLRAELADASKPRRGRRNA